MSFYRTTACSLAILTVLVGAVFAQGEMKKLSRTEAIAAVATRFQPDYPPIAKQLKVHGVAELEAVVAEDGTVERVNIVAGNPILTKPAAEALKKFKFKPIIVDGKAVKAVAPVNFEFNL
ncbi:MAG TPA: energy transducer TonB [Bryobacteraceae bacterium]|jgi:protein TonB